ncbi:hypothetical protein BH20VER3_BH20VER3_19740 [soil metagenome]
MKTQIKPLVSFRLSDFHLIRFLFSPAQQAQREKFRLRRCESLGTADWRTLLALAIGIGFFATILIGGHSSQAQARRSGSSALEVTPSPTPTPTPYPTVTELFGTASDGTRLNWTISQPEGTGPWPAVVLIHSGGFKTGAPGPPGVAADLARAGFLALAIQYRLAPPNLVSNQPDHSDPASGRPPQQTDDVALAIHVARTDPRCNGQVGTLGGSSGGSHAAYAAATGTPRDNKADVSVCLSGEYDYSDYSSLYDTRPNAGRFLFNVTNYVNTVETDYAGLYAASPVAVITSSVSPIYFISTDNDSMALAQPGLLLNKLISVGATNYQQLLIPDSSAHAFAYWGEVKDSVIAFLNAKFALPPPTPTPTVTPTPSPTPTPSATPIAVPPSITKQSGNKTVTEGRTARFSVLVIGTAPLTYQWRKNEVAIAGATSSIYITPPATLVDSGSQYSVVVTNLAGSATSKRKKLIVNPAAR